MRPIAFVDLETTGATAASDRITEIGIVEVDADGSVREWEQLVNPGVRIPPFIEQLTGICNAMVADAPAFADIAAETLRRLEGRMFIAHNARFDYGFLKQEFKRLGIAFRASVLCTVKLSRSLYPEYPRHNLDSLIERHGLCAEARHRALADAQLIHQFWQKIHVDRSREAIEAALDKQNADPRLPAHLEPGIIDDLPEAPGVYLFYGAEELVLQIGHAKDIRQRVLAHFAADLKSARGMKLAEQVRRIEWIETAGEIGALLQEANLHKKLQAVPNGRHGKSEAACTWTLVDESDGRLRPRLAIAGDLDFAVTTAAYGLFKNVREANKALRELAGAHQLCEVMLGLEPEKPGQPCSAHRLKRCKGACIGNEPLARHTMRLISALTGLKLLSWPFGGPAVIREGEEAHLVDGWRYLGTARRDDDLADMLSAERPPFDREIYKLLAKYISRLTPLAN